MMRCNRVRIILLDAQWNKKNGATSNRFVDVHLNRKKQVGAKQPIKEIPASKYAHKVNN